MHRRFAVLTAGGFHCERDGGGLSNPDTHAGDGPVVHGNCRNIRGYRSVCRYLAAVDANELRDGGLSQRLRRHQLTCLLDDAGDKQEAASVIIKRKGGALTCWEVFQLVRSLNKCCLELRGMWFF